MPPPLEPIVVEAAGEGMRIDVYLAAALEEELSRSQIKRMIEEKMIRVGGREITAHYKLKIADVIEIDWPDRPADETRAEDIPLNIIHEDEDVILLGKPPGMVVHPAPGNPNHTLVNALLYHVKGLSNRGGAVRPGIVHRLDKDTSGIMIVAKNDKAHDFIAKQFKEQTIERIYRVAVSRVVQHDEGVCEEPVGRAFLNRKKIVVKPSGGKDACTHFKVMKRYPKATLLELRLQTGRTHQIRVHMTHLGHPVLGDEFYGIASPHIKRQAVHAYSLGFLHPSTKKNMFFHCPLPADFEYLLTRLESEKNVTV